MNAMLLQITQLMASLRQRQQGQTLVEYALIIVLVSVAAIAALTALAGDVNAVFAQIGATLTP